MTDSTPDEPLLSLDALAERWRCTPDVAADDAERHNLSLCVFSRSWRIEWGHWLTTATAGSVDCRGIRDIAPCPPLGGGDDVGWMRVLGPRRVDGLVGVLPVDVERLLKSGDEPVPLRQVHGLPLGHATCGRLVDPVEVSISLSDVHVRTPDVEAMERALAGDQEPSVAAQRNRELLALLRDADSRGYAPSLALAVDAWQALWMQDWQPAVAVTTNKARILAWLRAHGRGFDEAEIERIARLLNPNPKGGRPRQR